MKCRNCVYNISNKENDETYSWCVVKNNNLDIDDERECENYLCMTNGDRIRSMTDEELAEFIKDLSEHCLAGIGEVNCSNQITCENCKITAMKWLQKEVE